MADADATDFIKKQLAAAGVGPSDNAVLDYAMCTVQLLAATNMKLHERIRELEKQLPKRRPTSTTMQKGSK